MSLPFTTTPTSFPNGSQTGVTLLSDKPMKKFMALPSNYGFALFWWLYIDNIARKRHCFKKNYTSIKELSQ